MNKYRDYSISVPSKLPRNTETLEHPQIWRHEQTMVIQSPSKILSWNVMYSEAVWSEYSPLTNHGHGNTLIRLSASNTCTTVSLSPPYPNNIQNTHIYHHLKSPMPNPSSTFSYQFPLHLFLPSYLSTKCTNQEITRLKSLLWSPLCKAPTPPIPSSSSCIHC